MTSTGASDPQIGHIWDQQGFNGKPALVTSNDEKSLLAAGHIRMYRGVNAGSKAQAKGYTDQFKTADKPFFGLGIYGNGHYFATHPSTANQYSGGSSTTPGRSGDVMNGFLHKDANVADHSQLQADQQRAISALQAKASNYPAGSPEYKRYRTLAAVIGDTGRYAAMTGVDAIQVRVGAGQSYYVIQNRSAMIMEV